MDNSPRANLIDNRYVIRKGHFTIDGDNVSLSIRTSESKIDCHHLVGHLDNQCPDAQPLQMFDKAIGGKAAERGWDYLKFPVWSFTKIPPHSTSVLNLSPSLEPSWAMIARTDADCHGNVVDGDQLQSDLDVSPRTAADYRGPISYQLAQALSDLDELLGREKRFFERYQAACIIIEADKHGPDDFFFTAQTDAARDLLSNISLGGKHHLYYFSRVSNENNFSRTTKATQLVEISELSPRRFKKLVFTARVFVLQKLRQRPLTRFSKLRGELASMFALSISFACGLLCRMLPQSSIIGINKCAFAHAKSIDANGRVILDVEITLLDVFLGEGRIFGKVLDSKRIVVLGSEVDDVCVVLERQETLHVVEVRQKSPADSMDTTFKPVKNAGQLIVGFTFPANLLRRMSGLSEHKLKEAVTSTSSLQRAVRILCSLCDSDGKKGLKRETIESAFYYYVIPPRTMGHMVRAGDQRSILRTAMVSGMHEASDEAKVEKVMRSIHAMVWAWAIRDVIAEVYTTKVRSHGNDDEDSDGNRDYNSDMLVRVSTGADVQECEPHSDAVLFSSPDDLKVAALIRGGFALGMRIERPVGTVIAEGNGRDRMILTVGDDIMKLVTESTDMWTELPRYESKS